MDTWNKVFIQGFKEHDKQGNDTWTTPDKREINSELSRGRVIKLNKKNNTISPWWQPHLWTRTKRLSKCTYNWDWKGKLNKPLKSSGGCNIPSPGVIHNDPIINREWVSRKACYVPCPDLNSLTQCLTQRKVIRARNVLRLRKTNEYHTIKSSELARNKQNKHAVSVRNQNQSNLQKPITTNVINTTNK